MPDVRCRLEGDDVVVDLDLASAEHQAVVMTAGGQRLTRFRVPHSRAGLDELIRRTAVSQVTERLWSLLLLPASRSDPVF